MQDDTSQKMNFDFGKWDFTPIEEGTVCDDGVFNFTGGSFFL